MEFEFATAGRIVFGPDAVSKAADFAVELGRRPLVVGGGSEERSRPLVEHLAEHGLEASSFPVGVEPTVEMIRQATAQVRGVGCDLVVAIGGGSVIDAGKAVAGLATNPGDPLDFLEVIGRGRELAEAPLPCIAIPTTSGTGAEVTRNAVLRSPEHQAKVSLRSHRLFPAVALIDPELTVSLPPSQTAGCGLDALTQLLEPFVSSRRNPLTDAICREAIPRAARSLVRAYDRGADLDARRDMALVSLSGGIALTNGGLGAVHGLAAPLGGMLTAPHGALCARLLPFACGAVIRALESRGDPEGLLDRFDEIGRLLTGFSRADRRDGLKWLEDCCRHMRVPSLSALGLRAGRIPAVVEKARRASSMRTSPVELGENELADILTRAL
jgi:alcohol dehydrogenase class IV